MQNKKNQRTRKRAAIGTGRGLRTGKALGREASATEEQPDPARAVMSFGNLRVNAAHLNEPVVQQLIQANKGKKIQNIHDVAAVLKSPDQDKTDREQEVKSVSSSQEATEAGEEDAWEDVEEDSSDGEESK